MDKVHVMYASAFSMINIDIQHDLPSLHAPTIALPTCHLPHTSCCPPHPCMPPLVIGGSEVVCQHPVDICQWSTNMNEKMDKVGKMGVGDNKQGKLLPPPPHLLTSHAAVFTWLAHPLASACTEPNKGEV